MYSSVEMQWNTRAAEVYSITVNTLTDNIQGGLQLKLPSAPIQIIKSSNLQTA
jgi:hypothetical protein